MKSIAVIGTGIMGSGIAANFLKKGYKVYVWNRNKAKLKDLSKLGGIAAKTPSEAVKNSDLVFEVTANDTSSQSVWLGKNGILAGANGKKVLIVCGTLSIKWIEKLAQNCAKNKFSFMDMPLTGSRHGAETGTLTLLVGGNKKTLDNITKDLKAISEKIYYFGKVGNGMKYKLILNMLQAIHMVGLGEALALAKDLGLNINDVGNALIDRPGGAPTNSGWKAYQKQPEQVNFALEWVTKDLKYTKEIGKKIKTPLFDKVLAKYKSALKRFGHKDWTIINKI